MSEIRSRRSVAAWALFAASALALGACGGSPRPAESPDPPLDDAAPPGAPAASVAAASSPKVQQGIDAIQRQDFASAKAALTAARAEVPKDAQAAYYLGVSHEGLGEIADADKQYREALELDPNLVEASANLSAILLDSGKAAQALEVIDRALKITPKHPDLLVNRALALEAFGDSDRATAAYGHAVAARPDDPELRLAYSDMLLSAGKRAEALAQVKAAGTPSDPKLLASIAHRFGKLGAPSECIGALDRALRAQPEAELYVRRGICRHDFGDDPGAKADFEAALKADPSSAPGHYYLGRHLAPRNKAQARKHLRKAVELTKGQGLGKAAQQALDDLE